MSTHKVCNQCNQLLEINMFHRKSKSKDGYNSKCKRCCKMNKDARPKETVNLTCEVCGKNFNRYKVDAKRSNKQYCSRICYDKALTEYNFNRRAGKTYPCSICGKHIYATDWTKNTRKYMYCSVECKDKGWSKFFSKENSPKWREDKPYEDRVKERLLGGYKKWRESVYQKDNYTCQCCRYDKGKKLVAHHKNGWDQFPEQRYDIENGVTLCKTCHDNFHGIYGFGNNTEIQFKEWIGSNKKIKNVEVVLVKKQKKQKKQTDTKPKLDESRILAQQKALKLFKERKNNGLTINQIAEITGLSRAWIYVLARKKNISS